MMAAGGTQLKKVMEDNAIYAWKFHVDRQPPSNTAVTAAHRSGPLPLPLRWPTHQLRAAA